MLHRPLSRRTFLRGAAGAAVGLPFLEAMTPLTALAQSTGTKRFVVAYGGISHGSFRVSQPASTGALTTLPRAFVGLEAVKQHVTIISKLAVPTYATGQTPGPGQRKQAQHGMIAAPILTGVHSREAMPVMPVAHSGAERGVDGAHTVDQLVADAIGSGTLLRSLQTRVQTIGYGGGGAKGILSGRMENGTSRALAPITSLETLHATLFALIPSGPPATGGTLPIALRRKQSVLDLVLGDATRLQARLGNDDRLRLDSYFEEIRSLERRIGGSTGGGTGGACTVPAAPNDPPIGNNAFAGWSSETERGDIMADMIALALACDITRAVSWMITFDQCFMTSRYAAGPTEDMHAMSHQGTAENLADNASWHAARFARLVAKLEGYKEGASSVLDNTFAALVFAEGESAHNSSAMTFVAAGSKHALKMGQHINAGGEHPARMMISGMQALGMNVTRMGEISGTFGALMV